MPDPLEELRKPPGDYEPARRQKPSHPKGFEPGFVWNGTTGEVIIRSEEQISGWDEFVANVTDLPIDPQEVEPVGPIEVRSWDMNTVEGLVRAYYYRAKIAKRVKRDDPDYRELLATIRKRKKRKANPPEGDHTIVVCLSDWQLGKRDGDGTEGIVGRVLQSLDDFEDQVRALRAANVPLGALYVAGMGDLVEGCDGHYAMQTHTVELDRRRQVTVARRLLDKAIDRWSRNFKKVVVLCVPGNHGENRKDGKAFTTFGDNDDVAVFEQLAEAYAKNPDRYGHIRWVIPDDELVITLDIAGTIVAFAHGHQFPNSKWLQRSSWEWWQGQMKGMRPAGDADLLVHGHFHQTYIHADGARTVLGCPTLDGGSDWFANTRGVESQPGTLTFVVGPDGWDHLRIL